MALHISQATWASISHPDRTVTVTDIVQKIVDTKCGGRYLFIHREESKIALFGLANLKATESKELYIVYSFNGSQKQAESFYEDQEVLIGDIEAYFQSNSDQYGYIAEGVADSLLFRYRPILVLHPAETSFPASVEWYLQRVSLNCFHQGQGFGVLDKIEKPEQLITSFTYSNYTYHSREKCRFFLRHRENVPITGGEGKDRLSKVPYYGSVSITADGDICLTYFFFYAYNGAIMENALLPSAVTATAGTHQGDWEYVSIRLSPDGNHIRAVHMSRHSGREGKWYLAESTAEQEDSGWHLHPEKKRLVIYPGKESHANYNVCGSQARGFLAAVGGVEDQCGLGPIWDPEQVVNLGTVAHPRMPWLRYAGMWGKPADGKLEGNGPEGPILKGSFYGRHLPMTVENSIPVAAVGDNALWAKRKVEEDTRIATSGTSLIRVRKPAAAEMPSK